MTPATKLCAAIHAKIKIVSQPALVRKTQVLVVNKASRLLEAEGTDSRMVDKGMDAKVDAGDITSKHLVIQRMLSSILALRALKQIAPQIILSGAKFDDVIVDCARMSCRCLHTVEDTASTRYLLALIDSLWITYVISVQLFFFVHENLTR